MEGSRENYYLDNAEEIREIGRKEKCDIGVAVLKFEEKIRKSDIPQQKEFVALCGRYGIDEVVEMEKKRNR